MPALIIANPKAGTNSPQLVPELTGRCESFLPSVEVHWTTGPGDATAVARAAATRSDAQGRLGLMFAVGGDGTVREVVEGLVAAGASYPAERDTAVERPALMVIPAGTGNSNYLAQWGDLPWRDAVGALAGTGGGVEPEIRMLDLCRLVETGELVLLGACSGLIAQALVFARDIPLTGRPRYQAALAQAAAAYRPYVGRVEVDGTVMHEGATVLANIGGGRHRGGQYQVLPHSLLDDGLLDVCVIGAEMSPEDVPKLTRDGGHLGRPGVVYARGRRISVSDTGGEPMWFEHDGELLPREHSTVTLEVMPGLLPTVCRGDRPIG
jgi:diacylglycerol kinase (ATP)